MNRRHLPPEWKKRGILSPQGPESGGSWQAARSKEDSPGRRERRGACEERPGGPRRGPGRSSGEYREGGTGLDRETLQAARHWLEKKKQHLPKQVVLTLPTTNIFWLWYLRQILATFNIVQFTIAIRVDGRCKALIKIQHLLRKRPILSVFVNLPDAEEVVFVSPASSPGELGAVPRSLDVEEPPGGP